jgi:SAM-dependent methyltransferase
VDEATRTKINELSWFHAINFREASSPGRGGNPPNWSLFGTLSFLGDTALEGARCLDVGAMDGLASFIMKERGAARVVATDLYDRPQFRLARSILGLETQVEYLPTTHLSQLGARFGRGAFDVVVFAGVLYHVFSPLISLMQCRKLLKTGGLLIVETMCTRREEPILILNPEQIPPPVDEYTTYFVPTRSAVEGMLKLAGFEVLASLDVKGRNRTTVLARASRPSEIPDRSELLCRMHDRLARGADDLLAEELSYYDLERDQSVPSSITYSGARGARELDVQHYVPLSSLQPTWSPAVQTEAPRVPPPARELRSFARRARRLSGQILSRAGDYLARS